MGPVTEEQCMQGYYIKVVTWQYEKTSSGACYFTASCFWHRTYLGWAVFFARLQFKRRRAGDGNDMAVFTCITRAVRKRYLTITTEMPRYV